jgi:hypothetical protein
MKGEAVSSQYIWRLESWAKYYWFTNDEGSFNNPIKAKRERHKCGYCGRRRVGGWVLVPGGETFLCNCCIIQFELEARK